MIDFGREACGRIGVASKREWLVTNGIGGFAMGTIAGMLTRRYHGLLVAALQPPVGRTLMLAKLDETVQYQGEYYPLFVDQWYGDDENGVIEPHGYNNLERFRLVGTVPHWTFAMADAQLEKRVWMEQGSNTTYIQYRYLRGSGTLSVYPKALINYRDYHQTTIAADMNTQVDEIDNGLKITMFPGAHSLYLLTSKGDVYQQEEWYEDYFYAVEEYRGMPDVVEDHLHIADFAIDLQPGESFTIVASTDPNADLDGPAAFGRQQAHEAEVIAQAEAVQGELDTEMKQLLVAADQFVVKRQTEANPDGHSIIAGYPWFSDWGRDTMISIPGLTLCNGRTDIAESILRTYAQYIDQGMLPNRFPDLGETPEYNTADATLWYFQAVRTYLEATENLDVLRELYPKLQEVIDWHHKGTRYSIKVDENDGLLHVGEEGVQLTWMDVKIGNWVVTPRTGKPVEINALWYNALRSMVRFAEWIGEDGSAYKAMADKAKAGFERFWCSPEGHCYDVIDGPNGHDSSIRPNQLLAVSLSHSPLSPERQKAVLDLCTRKLLTSHGLRTLAPSHDDFAPVYGGDMRKRDSSYHQGTVWGWLIGPFIAAHLRVYKDPEMARSYLEPAFRHIRDHCLGSISEVFDGGAPFAPRGCPAQAWSVAEYLRAWCMIRTVEKNQVSGLDA